MTKKQSILSLLLSFLLVGAVSGLSALLTREGMKSYETIVKPPLSPPGIVFPIVWSILFALMAISAWMVLRALAQSYSIKGALCSEAMLLYFAQLAVNFFWPVFFFRFGWRLFALIWLIWLILLIVLVWRMVRAFWRVLPAAGALQIPYLVWLLFAAYLNTGVWVLN